MVFLCLSVIIGAVTFTGSLVACAKLDDLFKNTSVPAWLHLTFPLLIAAVGLVTGLASYYRPAFGRDSALLQVRHTRTPPVHRRSPCGPAWLVLTSCDCRQAFFANCRRCRLSLRSCSLFHPLGHLMNRHHLFYS